MTAVPLFLLTYLCGRRREGGATRGSSATAPRRLRQIRHDPPRCRRGEAAETLMAADVCGPTSDPFPGSVMGSVATVSIVGSRGPTRQGKCEGEGEPPVRSRGNE